MKIVAPPNIKKQLLCVTLVVIACAFIGACSKQPELSPLAADATVLAFGDSLTYGTGAKPDESYPTVLAQLLNRKVVNGGVSGELSSSGLARLPGWLDEHKPALLILCHGGNDMLRKQSLDNAAANLREMIALARARNVQVVMLGVPRPGLLLSAADFYAQVAEQTGVPYQADTLAEILAKRSLKSDAVHPNGAGYKQMAYAVFDLLDNAGAL